MIYFLAAHIFSAMLVIGPFWLISKVTRRG